jgi:hypothetical protein
MILRGKKESKKSLRKEKEEKRWNGKKKLYGPPLCLTCQRSD